MALDQVSATVSSVSGSASAVTLLAANRLRRGLSVFNDSTATLYVKCGSSASASDYTVRLGSGDLWECPFALGNAGSLSVYTGVVTGIWASATGDARVTEFS